MKSAILFIFFVVMTVPSMHSFAVGPSPGVQRSSSARSAPPPNRAHRQGVGTAGSSSRTPRVVNSQYAGKTYPAEKLPKNLQKKYPNGVRFDKDGYPIFGPYANKEVKVPNLTGDYASDFRKANKAAGYTRTPDGYTWHHHQDGVRMQLLPSDLHSAVRHSGGAAVLRGMNN